LNNAAFNGNNYYLKEKKKREREREKKKENKHYLRQQSMSLGYEMSEYRNKKKKTSDHLIS
jgi:hypothetical protein